MKKIILITGILVTVLSSNFAYSKEFDWFNAGFCNGVVYGAIENGKKIEDISPAILNVVTKYTQKVKDVAAKIQVCQNALQNGSKTMSETQSCIKNIQPTSDGEFANGYTGGLGYAKMKGAGAAIINAATICPSAAR
jgi:hypothetical protein